MPRGQPDFGMYQQKTVGATLADMAELAARLGSIVSYDRRGDLIDFDDFEGAVSNWDKTEVDAIADNIFVSNNPKRGSQCVRLDTSAGVLGTKGITRGLSILASKRIGVEISFAQPDVLTYLVVSLYWYDGTTAKEASLKISRKDGKLYYLDKNYAPQEIASGLQFASYRTTYHTVKLVADFETGYFVRALLANVEYDLSAHAVYSYGSEVLAHVAPAFILKREAAVDGDIWLDQYILTYNEP